MFPQDELPLFHEVAHGEVLVEKLLNEELKHLVVELEGEGGVDQHPLNHLVQVADSWRRSKCMQHQVRCGLLKSKMFNIRWCKSNIPVKGTSAW